MPHRPAKEMFGKRAVVITQALGSGEKSAAKDIKDSLSWWGVSDIRVIAFKLMSDIDWNKIPEKKRAAFAGRLYKTADRIKKIDYTKTARTSLITKAKFYMVRMMQSNLGKSNPEYTDYKYWKNNGWIDKARPWKKN